MSHQTTDGQKGRTGHPPLPCIASLSSPFPDIRPPTLWFMSLATADLATSPSSTATESAATRHVLPAERLCPPPIALSLR